MVLQCRVTPNARKNQILSYHEDEGLKVKIKSPPLDGKANQELLKYLAKLLGIARRDIILVQGEKARIKRVEIQGLSPEKVASFFRKILAEMGN